MKTGGWQQTESNSAGKPLLFPQDRDSALYSDCSADEIEERFAQALLPVHHLADPFSACCKAHRPAKAQGRYKTSTKVVWLVLAVFAAFFALERIRPFIMNSANEHVHQGASEVIPVVQVTSHNDEMQAVPFTHALSFGIMCIEVDVHLVDGVLVAAHQLRDIVPGKTLQSVYLDPLYKMLERANATKSKHEEWRGIFEQAANQDLILMIDVKGEPEPVYDALLEALEPFREANWLTIYKDGELIKGPLTIIGTGDTPIDRVFEASPRYVFYDAPLVTLKDGVRLRDGRHVQWTADVAPMASSKWLWSSYYPNARTLRQYSTEAHKRGIKCRWWGHARWPGPFRRALWSLQMAADVDWINADDLADAAAFMRHKHHTQVSATHAEQEAEQARADAVEGKLL